MVSVEEAWHTHARRAHPLDDVVIISVDETWHARDRWAHALDDAERLEVERLRLERRRRERFAGRIAAKRAVQRATGLPFREIHIRRSCDDRDAGRPKVFIGDRSDPESSIYVSLAHSGGLAMAVARPAPVGLDLELVEAREPSFEALCFTADERRDLEGLTGPRRDAEVTRRFTEKEAVGKWRGVGLSLPFHALARPRALEVESGFLRIDGRSFAYTLVSGQAEPSDGSRREACEGEALHGLTRSSCPDTPSKTSAGPLEAATRAHPPIEATAEASAGAGAGTEAGTGARIGQESPSASTVEPM